MSLADLKPGDTVIWSNRYHIRKMNVEKVTKMHVIVGGAKYRIASGGAVGDQAWDHNRIEEATPEAIARWQAHRMTERVNRVSRALADELIRATRDGRGARLVDAIEALLAELVPPTA